MFKIAKCYFSALSTKETEQMPGSRIELKQVSKNDPLGRSAQLGALPLPKELLKLADIKASRVYQGARDPPRIWKKSLSSFPSKQK